MKKLLILFLTGTAAGFGPVGAADLKESKFTQVVNEVEIISTDNNSKRPAAVDALFKMPDVLRTGPASRAELVAEDRTITRVGANTIFSFDRASRSIRLEKGSILFNSPKGKGGGSVHTAAATAAVIGTTIIVTTTPDGGFKVLTLEGRAQVQYGNGMRQRLDAGQMTFVLPGGLPGPVIMFRLDAQILGSTLVKGFAKPLDSQPKIDAAVSKQAQEIKTGRAEDTGLLVGDEATPTGVKVIKLFDQVSASSSDGRIPGLNEDPDRRRLPPGFPVPPRLVFDDEVGGFTAADGTSSLLFVSSGASGDNPPVNIEVAAAPADAALDPQTISGDLAANDPRVTTQRVDIFSVDPEDNFSFPSFTGFIGKSITLDTSAPIDLNKFAPLDRFTFLSLEDLSVNSSLTINASEIPDVSFMAGSGRRVLFEDDIDLTVDTPSFSINSPAGLDLDTVSIQNQAAGGALNLFSSGDITLVDSTVSGGSVRISSGGALSSTGNGGVTGVSSVNLTSASGMTISAPVSADASVGSVSLQNSSGLLTVNNNAQVSGSFISLSSSGGVDINGGNFQGRSMTVNGGDFSGTVPMTIQNSELDLVNSLNIQNNGGNLGMSGNTIDSPSMFVNSFGGIDLTENSMTGAGQINVTGSEDVNLTDNPIDGGNVRIDAGETLVASRTSLPLGAIRGTSSITLDAGSGLSLGVDLTSENGSINVNNDSGVLAVGPGVVVNGSSVNLNSGEAVDVNGATFNGGGLSINVGANLDGGTAVIRNSTTVDVDGSFNVDSANGVVLDTATVTAGQIDLRSVNFNSTIPQDGSVSIEKTQLTALETANISADVVVVNNSTVQAGSPPLQPGSRLDINGGSVTLDNAILGADHVVINSDTFISAPNTAPGNGRIDGGAEVTLTAQNAMTLGISINANASAGTININNNNGALNVNGGVPRKVFAAAFINVSSPGGLLFDGTTINAANRVSLIAGSQNGTSAIVQNTSFGLSDVNIAGHTVILSSVDFADGSTVSLSSALGQLAPRPNESQPARGGYVNYINNVTYGTLPAQDFTGSGKPITIRPLQ